MGKEEGGQWRRAHHMHVQPNLTTPSEKSFLSHIQGVHTVQNWPGNQPLKASQKLHSFISSLGGCAWNPKNQIWSVTNPLVHLSSSWNCFLFFYFIFLEYVFFLFFFLFFSFLFLGAALEFCVRYMAEYPHYTNGFAYGNFIMVILWNSLEL